MVGKKTSSSPEEVLLGYLNFSRGAREPSFFAAWNELFSQPDLAALREPDTGHNNLSLIEAYLKGQLARLHGANPAFADVKQAESILTFVFQSLIPGYREFHRDMLAHLTADDYCQPFLLARFCEASLAELSDQEEFVPAKLLPGTLRRLNDYLGYRPVPVLEGEQRHKPYEHEFVCPIPFWVRGAGAAYGRYQRLLDEAMGILECTSEELLRASYFDLEQLEEIVLDPRGYDMEHPAHHRPNFFYGLWDPRKLNSQGYYCRFVLHDVDIAGIWDRVVKGPPEEYEELIFESAAVLAGTILMASGISGDRPGAILSTVQIDKWLQRIAMVRDRFYAELLQRCEGRRRQRLEEEAQQLRQPFGGTRQSLNQRLAEYRSAELSAVALAKCFAKMGAVEEARYWMERIHSGAARIRCEIYCHVSQVEWLIRNHKRQEALGEITGLIDLVHRAIECGALIDPWCILGFGGIFPIFEHMRDGVYDHRVEELIDLMRRIFQLLAALRRGAAASGDTTVEQGVERTSRDLADWWDQFATTAVSDINSFSGQEECAASATVANILREWRSSPGAGQNLTFWGEHAESLHSAVSYALLVDTLLQHRDPTSAMVLLVHWASRAEEVGLGSGDQSFQLIALRWFQTMWSEENDAAARWRGTRKFLDFLEANCEGYFHVRNLSDLLGRIETQPKAGPGEDEEGESGEEAGLFSAAYDGVIFRDSAADGYEGSVVDDEIVSDFALGAAFHEIADRCNFLSTVTLIRYDALLGSLYGLDALSELNDTLANWYQHAGEVQEGLLALAEEIWRYPISPPGPSLESLMEFDRRRQIRDSLLERLLHTALDLLNLRYLLRAILLPSGDQLTEDDQWEVYYPRLLRAVLYQDQGTFDKLMENFQGVVSSRPLLYQSLTRGGTPRNYFQARGTHRALGLLAFIMARAGWAGAMIAFITLVKSAEQKQSGEGGKISEIEHLFEAGAEGLFTALLAVERDTAGRGSHRETIEVCDKACQVLADFWATMSQEIYLSTLETAPFHRGWQHIREFIRQYGQEIFSPTFMTPPSLKAVLTLGPATWLRMVRDSGEDQWPRLSEALQRGEVNVKKAAEYLRMIIESVLENYEDYLDYNAMTTQSDYGQNLHVFLDFLRVKAEFQRREWLLKPFLLAHRTFLNFELWDLAEAWEDRIRSHFQGWTEIFVRKYERLRKTHGVHLLGLYEMLKEGFIFPFLMQHILALVRPAVQELEKQTPPRIFPRLVQRVRAVGPCHVRHGLRHPEWIEDFGSAIERAQLNLDVLERPWDWSRPAWEAAGFTPIPAQQILSELTYWGRLTRRTFQVTFTLPNDDNLAP